MRFQFGNLGGIDVSRAGVRVAESNRFSIDELIGAFSFNGNSYPFGTGINTTMGNRKIEPIEPTYAGIASLAKSNPVICAAMTVRELIFSEARFQFRQRRSGRPGDLFGSEALGPLENPWPNGTTGDLLRVMMQDVDIAGNAFIVRRGQQLRRMRPDWVSIVIGSNTDLEVDAWDVDAEVLGYIYTPGGPASGREPEVYLRNQVAHWAPKKDPLAMWRGMSWILSVLKDATADEAATTHKQAFFENGGTVNLLIKIDPVIKDPAKFKASVDAVKAAHEGSENAYKWLFLGGGSDAVPIGADMNQIAFADTQGAGETRIAMASRVPAVILQAREGLQGSSLNQGNYAMARRMMVDFTMRPLWRDVAGSLSSIIQVPDGAELWYDDRDIPALREDETDFAEIQSKQATTMQTLIAAGYTPVSVKEAVVAGDYRRLVESGLVSVQLQPPGEAATPNGNGNGNGDQPSPAQVGRALAEQLRRLELPRAKEVSE